MSCYSITEDYCEYCYVVGDELKCKKMFDTCTQCRNFKIAKRLKIDDEGVKQDGSKNE